MDEEWYTEPDPARWHLMKEKLTISAAFILFIVVFCMVALRLYVRWYVLSHLERSGRLNNGMLNGEVDPPVDRGLDPEVLDSLPVFRYPVFKTKEQSMQECTVCLSEFEENDRVRLLPKCNHSFHVDCIDTWLHSHSTCPVCRSKVEPVVKPAGSAEPVEEVCGSGPGSSSEVANTTSLEVTRKHVDGMVGPSTEVSQSDCELTQSSLHQLSSFKKLLKKPSIGTSREPHELDLESGPRESTEIRRPSE